MDLALATSGDRAVLGRRLVRPVRGEALGDLAGASHRMIASLSSVCRVDQAAARESTRPTVVAAHCPPRLVG